MPFGHSCMPAKRLENGKPSEEGLAYEKVQLKNHLDVTKKHWTTWHQLVSTDTMKWDPETRRFGASDEEWTEYLEANPDAAQFRFKELLFADKLDIIFGVNAGSGGAVRPLRRRRHSYYSTLTQPSTRPKKHHNYLTEREAPTHFAKNQDDSMNTGFHAVEPVTAIPDSNIERCYDAVESRSFMTIQSPLPRTSYSIEDCIKCLDSIEELEQGGELYLFALDIFLKQEYREIFLNLKKSSTRIAWLERLQSVGPQLPSQSDA
ncbi:L10-interacting MYB domain-containing protein [Abeliophyllum distichum]|uniref:L10-interacting MYB domain-containing protein n=1 Tax=Abeliophyllum distichum TaxID=126358 RepID=A0ABD1UL24_9LAMI